MNPHKGVVKVEYDSDSISFTDKNSFQSRNPATIRLIKKAWDIHVRGQDGFKSKRSLSVYTDDEFGGHCDYSFAVRSREEVGRCMPSFIFDSWPECGIASYEAVFQQMVSSGSVAPVDERVFWIGNISCPLKGYDNRRMGLSVASKHPDMLDFRSIEWVPPYEGFKKTVGYVSMPDHCKYRVLIDFGGLGFSARIPLLLASGRPVILVGHSHEAWFYWDGSLEPWVHYIPCGSLDGSDVDENKIYDAISWTFNNRDESAAIGSKGRDYAVRNLNHLAVVDKIGSILVGHFSADS